MVQRAEEKERETNKDLNKRRKSNVKTQEAEVSVGYRDLCSRHAGESEGSTDTDRVKYCDRTRLVPIRVLQRDGLCSCRQDGDRTCRQVHLEPAWRIPGIRIDTAPRRDNQAWHRSRARELPSSGVE